MLIKTHAWSDRWERARADRVLVTHRDLRSVLNSYRRMHWELKLPPGYIFDHARWQAVADLDVAFEDIVADGAGQVRRLAEALGVADKVRQYS